MSSKCTLHPTEAAHFQCYECGSSFCGGCISVRVTEGYGGKEKNYFCPGCNVPAEMLSLGSIIEPFWKRLPSIFLYPFQLTPLLLTLVLATLGTFFAGNIFVRIFVFVVMTKYAYETLTFTAKGSFTAPKVTWDLINQNADLVFKQYLIFGIFGALAVPLVNVTGPSWGIVYGIVVMLAAPSILMLLVATGSMIHAMNPVYFVGIILRIGLPYLLMYLFLFFLLAGPAALFSFLPDDLFPWQVYSFVSSFLEQFYILIGFHLMGYVLLQFHKEIGYHVDYEFFIKHQGGKKKRKKQTVEDELLRTMALLTQQGKYQEAVVQLQPYMDGENPDLRVAEKFLQLVNLSGERQKACHYAVRYLELLVQQQKKQKALLAYSNLDRDKEEYPSAETLLTLASWYAGNGEMKNAIDTYLYLLKIYPGDPLKPVAYFELARLLHEKGNNSTKARQIFQAIVTHYPGHDLVPQAKEYLGTAR